MIRTRHHQLKGIFRQLKNPLAFFLTLVICHAMAAVPVEAQRGRIIQSLTPKFGAAARVAESGALSGVKFTRIPRQSITPVFNSAAGTRLTRDSVTGALRSTGIRRRAFNVVAGSMIRTPRVLPVAAKLPALNSASYAFGRTSAGVSSQAVRQAHDIRKLLSPHLSQKAKLELGKTFSEATGRAAAARALETQAAAINKIFNQRARLHKNSRFYRGPSHVYVIVAPDGRLYKVGESSAGLLKSGLSKRAQSQVNKLNQQLPPGVTGGYRSRIIKTFDSKQQARDYERELILRYRQKYEARRFVLPRNREHFARPDNEPK
jgi:hypothetical protein